MSENLLFSGERLTLEQIMRRSHRSMDVNSSELREILERLVHRRGQGDVMMTVQGTPRHFLGKLSPFLTISEVNYYGPSSITTDPLPWVEIVVWVEQDTQRQREKWSKYISGLVGLPESHVILVWRLVDESKDPNSHSSRLLI